MLVSVLPLTLVPAKPPIVLVVVPLIVTVTDDNEVPAALLLIDPKLTPIKPPMLFVLLPVEVTLPLLEELEIDEVVLLLVPANPPI